MRSALGVLEQKGLITHVKGKGRIVVNDAVPAIHDQEREKTHVSHLAVIVIGGDHLMGMYSSIASVVRDALPNSSWMVSFWHLKPRNGATPQEYPSAVEQASAYFIAGDYTSSDLVWFCNQQKPLMVLGQAGDDVLRNFGHSHIHVFYDVKHAYERAVDLLWSMGYRRPAILINSNHQADLDRYEGFCRSLRANGCDPKDFLCITASSGTVKRSDHANNLHRAVDELLSKRGQFDSVVTNSYDVLLCEMYRRRLFVPDDFALVAQSTGRDAFVEEFGITEIRVDNMVATRSALNIFLDIDKANTAQGWHGRELVLTPEFIIRESCPKI